MLLAIAASYFYRRQIENSKGDEASKKTLYHTVIPTFVAICIVEFVSLAVAITMAASGENRLNKVVEIHLFFAMLFPTFYIIFACIYNYVKSRMLGVRR